MDLLPVEIKVNVEGDVTAALEALGESDGAAMTTRRIWFAEGRDGVAQGRLPLLEGGVIVRFRIDGGGGPDDLTVKLRPCEREQLVGRFSAPFESGPLAYGVEEDWSVSGRVLAASLVHDHPPGALPAAVRPEADPAAPIDEVQDQFVHACAPAVRLDGLVALGPILSAKARDVPLGDLVVNLETWSAAGLDFLEASIRVKPKSGENADELTARAERKQRRLNEAVRERGLTVSEHSESKTRRVLTALAEAARQSG
ncbi:hypothetical protein GCM10010503_36180 [Streptomyces lucensis JCM 4490]|uniref:CYTH domain-containing protein n=1 Tax=Streptomyces lucensis JCM 4490 TaxID=1306176 RepID=A0A918J7I0_9ACTN|nr:hypothetical protein [Streptomyces lucensis]GGW55837.1 hypothetical protein GCM10010503_36180 [Streptomyces lucensis JCM 4490]